MDANRKMLVLDGIIKDFPGTRALNNVTFDLCYGEVHCLVGENGAGKSTLIKILSGAEVPSKGKIILFGKSYSYLTPAKAMALKISTIYQDVNLVDYLTVADNIFLGNELRNRFGVIDHKKQEMKATEIMEQLKIEINPRILVANLSPADKQIIQVVKAIRQDAKIIVMDEPTSSLGFDETKALVDLIRKILHKGKGIIYISHHLHEVMEIGVRITVLKDGEVVNTYRKPNFSMEKLINDMVGRSAKMFFYKERIPIKEDIILSVENYSRGDLLNNISFTVKGGEIFGIGGMVGSGRTELARLIFGADKREKGELIFNDRKITPRNPKEAIRNGVCLLTEDKKEAGLFLIRAVLENISIAYNELKEFFINLARERNYVFEVIKLSLIHI